MTTTTDRAIRTHGPGLHEDWTREGLGSPALQRHIILHHGFSDEAVVSAGPFTFEGLTVLHDETHEHFDRKHIVRWFARDGREWIPRNRHMRGRDWGWDVKCSCGQASHTGGAIEIRIREAVNDHKEWGDKL